MTGPALALGILGLMFALMLLRTPIAVSMFAAGSVGYVLQAGWTSYLHLVSALPFARFANYDLSVIPLFILMGQLATQGGISRSLFAFTSRMVGRLRGGLAMAAVLASAAFGAICGSSVATAATITGVALPEMQRHGYSGQLATGTLAAAGTLGILIPPSVPLVIYAILTEQNIAKLFLAATVPGIIAMFGYMLVIFVFVRLAPEHLPPVNPTRIEAEGDEKGVWSVLALFALVFGGIYGGWFSPTEGAAVGAAGAFAAAWLRGEMDASKLRECAYATAQSTGMIFLVFLGADIMNSALVLTQLQQHLLDLVQHLQLAPIWIMVAIVLLHLVLGTVTEELSIILLTIPIFFPVVMSLDFGLPRESVALWFGIMILMVVSFGMLVPPMGLNVYVVNAQAPGVTLGATFRGVLPFLASDLVRIVLLLMFPQICLWLVALGT